MQRVLPVRRGVVVVASLILLGAMACGGGGTTPDGGSGGGGGGSATGGGSGGGATGGSATGGGTGGASGATTGPGNTLGCQLSGTWGASHAAGPTTMAVQFQGDAGTTTLDRTGGGFPDVHVEGTFSYDVAAGHVQLTNTAVQTTDSAFDACIGVLGTYSINFPDCSHFGLTLVSDACAVRTQWANGSTITRQ